MACAAADAPTCDLGSAGAGASEGNAVVVYTRLRSGADGDALLEALATRSTAAALSLILDLPCEVRLLDVGALVCPRRSGEAPSRRALRVRVHAPQTTVITFVQAAEGGAPAVRVSWDKSDIGDQLHCQASSSSSEYDEDAPPWTA